MKRLEILLVLVIMVIVGSGCADLRSKFIPKKKDDKLQAKHYYAVREYDVKPNIELYTKRYIYWKNWQKEIMDVIGDKNQKKLIVAIEQAISNLMDMRDMLIDEKGDKLQVYIDEMEGIEKRVKKQRLTPGNQVRIRRRLETLGKQIKVGFSYNKVKDDLRDEFRTD